MKNLYHILNISPLSNLETILKSYQTMCMKNPIYIFIYTNALSILTNPLKRMIYDASLYQINLNILFQKYYIYEYMQEIDEYTLANFIGWLEDFKNYCYDLKYHNPKTKNINKLENWYNDLDNIIENLKKEIKTFYLI